MSQIQFTLLPSPSGMLRPIFHHGVEQVIVEYDSLARTGVFDVKDKIRDAIVWQTCVAFPSPPNDRSQRLSPSSQGSLIVSRQDLFDEIGEAVDS
jgi:hypothetical protein